MKLGISAAFSLIALGCFTGTAFADLRDTVLRDAALRNGIEKPSLMMRSSSAQKSEAGRQLFESKLLSLNGDIACRTCHLDRFSSADGLPNAVGVGGSGEGTQRLQSGGVIVPRNTLPLWGRGAEGFRTFFWDGKVEQTPTGVISQFGVETPSDDPLAVAVHLPIVEIREMVVDDEYVSAELEKEDVSAAEQIYEILTLRVRRDDALANKLQDAFGVGRESIVFAHIADSIVHFIRDEFRIRETKFHRFVFKGGALSDMERDGGLVFFGKGRCALCHTGPHFTDFGFHSIPFPQIGFGKNGFGIDYGRYNVTFDDRDIYRFRTAPLFNVAKTAPYSHSGAVVSLEDAIRYHFDPLRFFDPMKNDLVARTEYYKHLSAWSGNELRVPTLSDDEVAAVVAFLGTLSFETPSE